MKFQTTTILLAASAVVSASPYPQGVTSQLSPSAAPPKGCSSNYKGPFGISVIHLRHVKHKRRVINGAVSQIADGQIQAPSAVTFTMAPVTQISDGQIQAPTSTFHNIVPVSQISDGQVQAPAGTTVPVVTQIGDGQIQAPTQSLVTLTVSSTVTISKAPVTQIGDHQIQAPISTKMRYSISTWTTVVPAEATKVPVASSGSGGQRSVACRTGHELELSLTNGVLTDGQNWTGYIASNFQFQFDNPPQAGSIYTSGFTVCRNGSLSLGGSTVWYQCLSGNFYNLYDRHWAAQCEPVELSIVQLVNC